MQTRKSYHDFVGQFDALVDTDVRWTRYTAADIYARAPSGLSSLCLRDHEYRMMRKPILYDIHIEEYHVNRVMRQFVSTSRPRSRLCTQWRPTSTGTE